MGPNIYKPGQGYWTRVMSALGFGLIALMGGVWFADQARQVKFDMPAIYVQAVAFLIIVLICGVFIYFYIGKKKKSVDFLIATEGEMKKVNWSTRREVLGMTWVVIGFTLLTALFIAFFDTIFYFIMESIRVIETGGA